MEKKQNLSQIAEEIVSKAGLYDFSYDAESNTVSVSGIGIEGILKNYMKTLNKIIKKLGLEEIYLKMHTDRGLVSTNSSMTNDVEEITLKVKKNENANDLFIQYYETLMQTHRQKFVETNSTSLDGFLTTDYSLGYADIYPLTADIKTLLEIGTNNLNVMKVGLDARYNYVIPAVKNKEDAYGYYSFSRDTAEFSYLFPAEFFAMNFLQELVKNKIVFDGKSIKVDPNASKEEIINACMPVILKMYGSKFEGDPYGIRNKKKLMSAIETFSSWDDKQPQDENTPSFS